MKTSLANVCIFHAACIVACDVCGSQGPWFSMRTGGGLGCGSGGICDSALCFFSC